MRFSTLLVLSILLSIGSVVAQTTISDYCRAVVDYSHQLKIAQQRLDEADAEQSIARVGMLPRLSANGDFSLALHSRSGIRPWSFSVAPQITTPLYRAGLLRSEYRQSELNTLAKEAIREFTLSEVIEQAEYTYWNLSAMELYHQVVVRYVEIIESLRRVISERFAEGYISKNDLLAIESRLSEATYDMMRTKENLEEARHNFNTLQGKSSDSAITLSESVLDSASLPRRESVESFLGLRADLQSARHMSSAAKWATKSTARSFLPRIDAGIGARWQPKSPNTRGLTELSGEVFVSLSTPIFHWGERRHSIARSKAQEHISELEVKQLEEDIMREESNAWSRLQESYAQVEAAERNLKIAAENLEIGTYSYNEGQTTIVEVLQAQLSWFQIYSNSIAAHLNYAIARSQYRHITGQEVLDVRR